MKVYGINYRGKSRRIVAAKSMKEAATLLGTTYSDAREYGHETRNEEEVELATRNPGQVWEKEYRGNAIWQQIMKI